MAELFISKNKEENDPDSIERRLRVRKAGLCPGSLFKWLFNCIILLTYMHIAMSIF